MDLLPSKVLRWAPAVIVATVVSVSGACVASAPAGATAKAAAVPTVGRLDGISCPSTSFCVAVGSGLDHVSVTDVTSAVLEYRGGSWATAGFANPSSWSTNWQAVDCSSPTFCVAAGLTAKKIVAVAEYTGTWSIFRDVSFAYEPSAASMQVSCASTVCMVSGYSNSETLEVSRSSLSQHSVPAGAGEKIQEEGVSCISTSLCRLTGYATETNGVNVDVQYTWDGSSWSKWSPPVGSGILGAPLRCLSTTYCVTWNALETADKMSVDYYNGTYWAEGDTSFSGSAVAGTDPDTEPTSFACETTSFCLQTGYFYNQGLTSFQPMAYIQSGASWALQKLPAPGDMGFLVGGSCASNSDCYAVGMYTTTSSTSGPWKPDLFHYDGSSWSLVKVNGMA